MFSRLVNSIVRTHRNMSEEELKDVFKNLTEQAEKDIEANDDVEAGFIAELEAELDTDEGAVLTERQKLDLSKTVDECEAKLKEARDLIQ